MISVIMLGWEYPPNITGGLGTACEGLTKALSQNGLDIQFVIPKVFGDETSSHMNLVEPIYVSKEIECIRGQTKGITSTNTEKPMLTEIEIPSFLTPYLNVLQYQKKWASLSNEEMQICSQQLLNYLKSMGISPGKAEGTHHYGRNLLEEVERFSQRVLLWANSGIKTDIIHAHDWMTFPAGILLKESTGCPLVVHIHSLEHDRSGEHGNPHIMEIEAMGMQKADRVIAVSHLTKKRIQEKYKIGEQKISVVHNGMNHHPINLKLRQQLEKNKRRYVLFLGRITFQKGPDYFVQAAKKVIPVIPNVTFVMGGAGDMLPAIKQQVRRLGLEKNFEFPGFLRGAELEKAYADADLYVMPSVSEPFGIAPLEAISYNTPVLISRQSGVSEVLLHALKANFWDVEELADLIIGVLKYPELKRDLLKMAKEEVRQITWESAAQKTIASYLQVFNS
jgi:glycosyltransferase involved in cell wall biosynthesis